MSQRKARTTRKASAPSPPTPVPEDGDIEAAGASVVANPESPVEMSHPAVVVFRVPVDGKPDTEEIKIMPVNGLDLLAVPTLLRKAAAIQEQQLGL